VFVTTFSSFLFSFLVLDAAELTEEDMPKENGGLLVISQSGETKDVYTAMALAQQRDIPCFSVVNAVRWIYADLFVLI
jgi:D-arabinose 5-phosphate isomerase GutQ